MKSLLDKKSTKIIFEFVSNKYKAVFIGLMWVLGNVSNIIVFSSIVAKKDFSIEKGNMNWIVYGIEFLHSYWIPITIIGLLLMYVDHIQKMLLPFLPDVDDYPLGFEEKKQHYASDSIKLNIVVLNRKNKKFINCRVKLTSLVYIDEDYKESEQIKSIGSNYLLWENDEIERNIDESVGKHISFATATLVSSEWGNLGGYNIIDFYRGENKKRLSDKGLFRYKVVVSGKNFRPIPHEGYFEFIHQVREVDEGTFGLPDSKDIEWGREYPIPLQGNHEGYRRFARFGFVKKATKIFFKP